MGTNHGGVNFGRRSPPIGGQFSTLNNNRIEETKPNVSEQGISPVGDEGYDHAIARAERLAREADLEEAARRRLQAELDEHAALSIEWITFQNLFREASEVDEQYRRLEERATREDVPRSLLSEWPTWQERNLQFEKDVQWALDEDTRKRWQVRPDILERIEQDLRHSSERKTIPELEEDRIARMVGAELARLRDPDAPHAFTRRWGAQEPLLAGERITLRLSDDGPQREAVVLQPGRTGGCTRNDVVELEWVSAATGRTPEEPVTRMSALTLAGCVHRAEWSDERLRQAELERQWPEPPASYPLDCSRDFTRGDRLWCSEVGGSETAASESSRLGRPAVVQIELEVLDITAEKTKAEDHCTLRELWRSDDGPCQEFSLLLDQLTAFARWRAFCGNEDERWSKTQAQEKELDQRRAILQQPGPHRFMRPQDY